MPRLLATAIAFAFLLAFQPAAEARTCVRFMSSGAHAYVKCPPKKARSAHKMRRQFSRARNGVLRQPDWFGGSGGGLISEAERFIGTNPTGWAHVWCGRFLAMVVRAIGGHVPRNPDLARNWATLPRTTPHPGAIAVLTRKGGGHVGVVTGFDHLGNPIIVSGNHGRRVGVGVYPRSRVVAYVSAT